MFGVWLLLFMISIGKISFAQPEDLGEIYSIGIKFRLDQLPRKKIFVADMVSDNEFSMTTKQCANCFKKFFYLDDTSSFATAENLDSSIDGSLKNIFKGYQYVRPITIKENSQLFSKGVSEVWDNFYKRYSGYAGIVFLSPIYFNRQHTKAIYQLSLASQSCGSGRNSLFFPRKDNNGKWHKTMPGKPIN